MTINILRALRYYKKEYFQELNEFCLTRVALGCRGLSPPPVMMGRTPDVKVQIKIQSQTAENTRNYNTNTRMDGANTCKTSVLCDQLVVVIIGNDHLMVELAIADGKL